MNKLDCFVLLVQTAVLHPSCGCQWSDNIRVVGEAMQIEPVALPDNLIEAASNFVRWKIFGFGKPDWLREYEENIATHVAVEQCDGLPMWWHNAEMLIDGATVPQSWKKFVTGRDHLVIMTKREAEAFVEWAKEVPGWDDEQPPLVIHEKKA